MNHIEMAMLGVIIVINVAVFLYIEFTNGIHTKECCTDKKHWKVKDYSLCGWVLVISMCLILLYCLMRSC